MPLKCFYPFIQFLQSFSRIVELIIVHSLKHLPSGFQTTSLLLQLWLELCKFWLSKIMFSLNPLLFYLSTIEVGSHLVICPTLQKFINFILKPAELPDRHCILPFISTISMWYIHLTKHFGIRLQHHTGFVSLPLHNPDLLQ
jgi:hypothetical protein